jgi:Domain of unknown function (DUF4388)
MALQGTLQDFGALEIFQLVALQQKTGTLEIRFEDQTRSFVFENGLLIAAHISPLETDSLLIRYLLELKYVTEDEVPGWINVQTHQPVDAIDLAAKFTEITAEQLIEAYELYLQTVLDEILTYPKGRFHFNSGKIGIPSKQLGPWKIEGLLMEGMRRLDELADLQAAEMPAGMVPRKMSRESQDEGDDRFAAAVLGLVDGKRSLHEIVSLSAIASFDLYQTLRRLRDQQRIELIEWIPTGVWTDVLWKKRSMMRSIAHGSLVVIGIALLTVGITYWLDVYPSPWVSQGDNGFLSHDCEASRASYNIANLMEAYRILHRRYPESYDALIEEGLLTDSMAEDYQARGLAWQVGTDRETYAWLPIRTGTVN